MDRNTQTSQETPVGAEQGGEQVLPASPSLTTGETAGEQQQVQSPKTYTEEEVKAREFRARQSAADKAKHEALLEYRRQQENEQARAREQAERERLAAMDDEELGSYTRQQQQANAFRQQAEQLAAERLGTAASQTQEDVLGRIKDDDIRAKLVTKFAEAKSLTDFVLAAAEAIAAEQVARESPKLEKKAKEAAIKEATAEVVDSLAPELGTGSASGSLRKMSREQLISEGYAEEVRKAAKSR
jgi:hypothetical protein